MLAGQARRLVEALEREWRKYSARRRPLVEAAARAQEIIPADELEAGAVREAPAALSVPEGVFFVRGERVWNDTGGPPFTEADLREKFHAIAAPVIGPTKAQRLESCASRR